MRRQTIRFNDWKSFLYLLFFFDKIKENINFYALIYRHKRCAMRAWFICVMRYSSRSQSIRPGQRHKWLFILFYFFSYSLSISCCCFFYEYDFISWLTHWIKFFFGSWERYLEVCSIFYLFYLLFFCCFSFVCFIHSI